MSAETEAERAGTEALRRAKAVLDGDGDPAVKVSVAREVIRAALVHTGPETMQDRVERFVRDKPERAAAMLLRQESELAGLRAQIADMVGKPLG